MRGADARCCCAVPASGARRCTSPAASSLVRPAAKGRDGSLVPADSHCSARSAPAAPALSQARSARQSRPRARWPSQTMQKTFYIRGSGLYKGEPTPILWPFSQTWPRRSASPTSRVTSRALRRANCTCACTAWSVLAPRGRPLPASSRKSKNPQAIPERALLRRQRPASSATGPGGRQLLRRQRVGRDRAGAHLRARPRSLCAATGRADHGVRDERLEDHQPHRQAWPAPAGCPSPTPPPTARRNTVTDAPGAELAVQLYRITGEAQYLQFAENGLRMGAPAACSMAKASTPTTSRTAAKWNPRCGATTRAR